MKIGKQLLDSMITNRLITMLGSKDSREKIEEMIDEALATAALEQHEKTRLACAAGLVANEEKRIQFMKENQPLLFMGVKAG